MAAWRYKNFSSRIFHSSLRSLVKYFFNTRREISYLRAAVQYFLCIVLPSCLETSWNIDLFPINVTRKNRKKISEDFIFETDADNVFSSLQCKNYVVNMPLYLYVCQCSMFNIKIQTFTLFFFSVLLAKIFYLTQCQLNLYFLCLFLYFVSVQSFYVPP